MLNKLNTKTLLFAFVILGALALIVLLRDVGTPKGSMREMLTDFDTATVTSVEIDPKEGDAYTIEKDGDTWKLVLSDGKKVNTDGKKFMNSFKSLVNLKPKKLVSKKVEKHKSFEVDDSSAIKVKVMAGDEVVSELMIGKFSFSQPPGGQQQQMMQQRQQPKIFTYVRLTGEDEVYSIDGGLSWDFNKKPEDWRNTSVVGIGKYEVSNVQVSGGIDFLLAKDSTGGWSGNGIEIDSAGIQKYLDAVTNMTSKNFNDNVSVSELGTPVLEIAVSSESDKTVASIYGSAGQYKIASTSNPGNVFDLTDEEYDKLLPSSTSAEDMNESGEDTE